MKIFSRKEDERFFVKQAVKLSERFKVRIESSAMMSNHFHFILMQDSNNKGIQLMLFHLQMSFARRYNKINKRRGPVFEGRFRSKLIDSAKYHWNIFNYVFWNPVK